MPPKKQLKSNYLRHPLSEELGNEEIFLGSDAIQIVKYHGSYQQVRWGLVWRIHNGRVGGPL